MLDDKACDTAAGFLFRAWSGSNLIGELDPAIRPRDTGDAYRVQRRVIALHGAPIAGWKIAGASPAVLEKNGVPMYCPVPENLLLDSAPTIDFGRFRRPLVEPEFALILGRDIDPGADIDAIDDTDLFSGLRLGCEIADSRYVDPGAAGLPSVIADLANLGAYMLGPAVADSDPASLPGTPVALTVDGETVADELRGPQAHDLVGVARVFLSWLSASGQGMSAGMFISTGTLTKPTPVAAPAEVALRFGDLGEIAFSASA